MNDIRDSYDVIVVGAGPAGCVAALQSARAGAKTLLIEKSSIPGGTTTLCGLDFPGLFHAWGRQVVGGIGWELVKAAVEEGGGSFPDFSRYDIPHYKLQVKLDGSLYACLLDEAFTAAGVDVLYHSMPLSVEEREDAVSLLVACKEGPRKFNSHVAVDASGDADVVSKAGFNVRRGEESQPATPVILLGGYDIEQLDLQEIEEAYRAAVAKGEMNYLDAGMSRSMAALLRGKGWNCIHVPAEGAETSEGKSKVERLGRAAVLRVYRFLKRFRGLERLEISFMAPQVGVRETAVIEGELTISAEDYMTGRQWEDSLCNAFYQIDLHCKDKGSGLKPKPLAFGVVPTVPRRALIPRGSRRLLVAGRCVSSDRLANSALRVQASCMAMGQAAGALAALSAKRRLAPGELEISEVKELLLAHGALLPSPS